MFPEWIDEKKIDEILERYGFTKSDSVKGSYLEYVRPSSQYEYHFRLIYNDGVISLYRSWCPDPFSKVWSGMVPKSLQDLEVIISTTPLSV